MRTFEFFVNQDITGGVTSPEFKIDCGQDMRFLIQNVLTSVTGTIRLFVEESIDGVVWTSMQNPPNCESYFELNQSESPIGIKDNYFMGEYMRLRIDAQGQTGFITSKMGYKSKV